MRRCPVGWWADRDMVPCTPAQRRAAADTLRRIVDAIEAGQLDAVLGHEGATAALEAGAARSMKLPHPDRIGGRQFPRVTP
jgi:hypothetical protein